MKMTRACCITIIFTLLFAQSANAQFLIRGKVCDSITKEPLPYTSISIPEEKKMTLTNNDGYFEIRSEKPLAHLQVSYFGYEPKEFKLTLDKAAKDQVIYLKQKIFKIEEVVISPYKIENLIRAVYNKYKTKQNESYLANAFYRDYWTVDNFPVNASEIFYNVSLNQSGIGAWNFVQGRSAEAKIAVEKPSVDFLFTGIINNSFYMRNWPVTPYTPVELREHLEKLFVLPVCENPRDNYIYKIVGEKLIDNKKVSVISFYPKTTSGKFRFNGKMELIEDDLQIIYLEIVLNHPLFFYRLTHIPYLEKRNQYIDSCYLKHIWHYNKINDDWVLERIENLKKIQVRSKVDKSYKKINSITSNIFFFNYTKPEQPGLKKQMKIENDRMLIRENKYDANFWKNNSGIISEISFEQNIKESFLENGFYGNLFPGGIASKSYPQCSDLENKIIGTLNDSYYIILKSFVEYFLYYMPEKEIYTLFTSEVSPMYDDYINLIKSHKISENKLNKLNEIIKILPNNGQVSQHMKLWIEMNPSQTSKIITKLQQLEKKHNK